MKPKEIWELELWEYNAFIHGYKKQLKNNTTNCILTGYYTSYYVNGGTKAKSPNELIKSLFVEHQSLDEGRKDIERIKKLEKGGV